MIDCRGVWLILQTSNISDWEVFFCKAFLTVIYEAAPTGIQPLIWVVFEASYSSNHRQIFLLSQEIQEISPNFQSIVTWDANMCMKIGRNVFLHRDQMTQRGKNKKEETVPVRLRHILLHMLPIWPYVWLPGSKSCPDSSQRNNSQNWSRFLSKAREKSCFCVCVLQAELTVLQVYFNQPAH